jgi:adenylate cyclase
MKSTQQSQTEAAPALADPNWSHGEAVLEAFEEAWQEGRDPGIADYLPADNPLRYALLVELVHVDLELRLRSGEPRRVEQYLSAFPELASDRHTLVDLLAAEYRWSELCNLPVLRSDYQRRFPELFDLLLERLEADSNSTRPYSGTLLPRDNSARPEFPGYEIIDELGRGGMGVVFQARDTNLDRHVAIKVLPPKYVRSPERLGRFLREARTASALNHPHICTIHAFSEHHGRPFLVMEFVEGLTMRTRMEETTSIYDGIEWIRQVAEALAAAHAAGVVHRDIKPENIMIRDDGYVKVLDFGLARHLPTLSIAPSGSTPSTATGALLGTAAYMSPEQTRGGNADSASDVFSLGIVAYELMTSRHPFDADSHLATLGAIATGSVVAPARVVPEIPMAISDLIEAMLNKDPRLRPTAAEVASILAETGRDKSAPISDAGWTRRILHRERDLAVLNAALSAAEAGRSSMVCVAGEPGIGKTTLVEDFLASLEPERGRYLFARGNCSERLANTEAYLPVIDALENLLRSRRGESAGRLLKVIAPAWYVQIAVQPGITSHGSTEIAQAASQPAMLREFARFLQEASRLGTIILFFDDVHWADLSTVDLLAHVGRHLQGLRIVVIVTYRPTEMLLGPHPFWQLKLDLQGRGACTEIAPALFTRDDVNRYLELAYENHAFSDDFIDLIFARTEGSPLFTTDLLNDLVERGVVTQVDHQWRVVGELPDLSREFPDSVRGTIRRKLDRLDDVDRQLLAVAAVQAREFESVLVADVCGIAMEDVDTRLDRLERIHGLVRSVRAHELPDGALSIQFAFVHVLYQQTVFHDLLPTRRAALSLALARAIEKRFGNDNPTVAAELACLYEEGRDRLKAAHQLWLAALNAGRIFAHSEAIVLARRGIDTLRRLPVSPERDALELELQTTLGLQLQVVRGYAEPSAKKAYERARRLCREGQGNAQFPVLWGLWLFHKVRSELVTAQRLADELMTLARQANDPDLALQAHQALAMTAFCRGLPAVSLGHVEQAAALYHPASHSVHAFEFGQDPGVICKAFGAVVLWLLGYPDAAARESQSAIAMSESLSPSSQAIALHFAAMVHQLRREPLQTRELAQRCSAIAVDHGFAFWAAGSAVLRGWAIAAECNTGEGVALLRKGLEDWKATGAVTYYTYFLGILAETLVRMGETTDARSILDEAIALADTSEEQLFLAELHRLRGIAIHSKAGNDLSKSNLANSEILRACEIAVQQEAKSLALRAATSMVHLHQTHNAEADESRNRLNRILGQFSEGFQTTDLNEAKALVVTS